MRTTPKSVGTARADLARDAARLVGRKLNRSAAAPFFAIAIEAPAETNVAACTDPDLTDAVIAALGRPPDWDEAKAAEALTEACWKHTRHCGRGAGRARDWRQLLPWQRLPDTAAARRFNGTARGPLPGDQIAIGEVVTPERDGFRMNPIALQLVV